MQLELKTSPEDFAGEHEIIERMFKQGLSCLHLSKPQKSTFALESWMMALDFEYHNRVIVYDKIELAKSLSIKGVVLSKANETDLATINDMRSKNDLKCYLLCNSLVDAEDQSKLISEVLDGIILNPLFDSIVDPNIKGVFNLNEVKLFLNNLKTSSKSKFEVLAMGGIDDDRFEELSLLNFDSLILCGAVWNSVWAENTLKILSDEVEKYVK